MANTRLSPQGNMGSRVQIGELDVLTTLGDLVTHTGSIHSQLASGSVGDVLTVQVGGGLGYSTPAGADTLAATLDAGSVTGGTPITISSGDDILFAVDGDGDIGTAVERCGTVFCDVIGDNGQPLVVGGPLNVEPGGNAVLKLDDSLPSAFAHASTAGVGAFFRAQDGAADLAGASILWKCGDAGADAGANPIGGDFIVQHGLGTGTGRDGQLIIRSAAGVDAIIAYDDATSILDIKSDGTDPIQIWSGVTLLMKLSPPNINFLKPIFGSTDNTVTCGIPNSRWSTGFFSTITGRVALADAAGDAVAITGPAGGTDSGTASTGQAGGPVAITAGAGSNAVTSGAIGGAGAVASITAGAGGIGDTGGDGGIGGDASLIAGAAGADGGSGTDGVAGNAVLLGGPAAGSGSDGYVEIPTAGSAPATAASANTIGLQSTDLSPGHTQLNLITEGTPVGSGTPTQDKTIAILVNGTQYYIHASLAAS